MKAIPILAVTLGLNIAAYGGASSAMGSNPISFTENKGQFADQNHQPRTDILFGGTDGQITFHISNKGISYQLYRVDSYRESNDPKTDEKRREIAWQTIYRTDLQWLNSNPDAKIKTDEVLPGLTNYYLDQCPNGALGVKSFKGITLLNIYNNINLHYYEKNGALKYDYIVAPNADYKQIQFLVPGAILELQKDGSLLVKTPLGDIQEQAPIVYQNGKLLKARYIINSNTITFEVDGYDPLYELIIDPVTRLWGTYYGGSGTDIANSSCNDVIGNVYMAGVTNSGTSTLIATTGAHQTTLSGILQDAFLVKFDNNGVRQWSTYYGGTGDDGGSSVCCDASGNVYLGGYADSNTGISTAGAHLATYATNYDAFLAKFNASGVRQWGTYYGGSGYDNGVSIWVDASANVFMVGRTTSTNGIATTGAHQATPGGGSSVDAFLVKFNSSGVRQWGTYYGGTGDDRGQSTSVDASGNVYMGGYTTSNTGTVIATAGAHQSTCGGGSDGFLVKFSTAGVRQWGTYYGGTGGDMGYASCTDPAGNVYLAGVATSNTGTVIATTGGHQAGHGGNNDAFLVQFNSNGQRQWGTYYGGNGGENGWSTCSDIAGNIYLAGETDSPTGTVIATAGAHQSVYGGGISDGFLASFDNTGQRLWGTYYGGTGRDAGYFTNCDATSNVYLAGFTASNTGTAIASAAAHQTVFSGGTYDAFMVKQGCSMGVTVTANSLLCSGASINFSATVPSSVSATFQWQGPNSFTSASQNPTIAPATAANAGSYVLIAKESLSCTETGVVTVTVGSPPTITVNSGSICPGSSFTINPGGASTYTFEGGTNVVTPNVNTSYTVIGTSSAGCLSSNTATSTVSISTNPTITVNSGSICNGNSFTINPGGASTYTIQGGSNVVSPGANTSYTVVGTSSQGCLSVNTATSIVTVHASPTITVNSGGICSGDSFTINPGGANTYTIQGSSTVVSPMVNTSYTVNGTSVLGCISSNVATSTVTVNTHPTITVNSGSICSGNSFTINPGGASTYTIQGGSNVVSPMVNTSYTVNGTSALGCISSNTAMSTVTVVASPTITVNSGGVCVGSLFTITPAGASTYTIQGGSAIVNPTTITNYTVIGTGSQGCLSSNIATSTVIVVPPPSLTVVASNTQICVGESAVLVATGAGSYNWGNNVTTASISVSPANTAVYTVTGTASGCSNTQIFILNVSLCTNVNEHLIHDHNVSIYPNPTKSEFILELDQEVIGPFALYDVTGRMILNGTSTSNRVNINISNLASGVYYVKIESRRFNKVIRVVKQ